ncbi:MAG TPA: hypothetical protein VFG05_08945 [Methylocella sp.]|nr:hypothetical protein [Methylocella sp.]
MKKLYIFGDSHVNTLIRAWNKVVKSDKHTETFEINFYGRHGLNWFVFEMSDFEEGFRIRANNAPQFRSVDYIINDLAGIYFFSSPLHSTKWLRDGPWKTHCPWTCISAAPGLQAVSSAVIETWVMAELRCRFAMLQKLTARDFKVIVIEPPKPFARLAARLQINPAVIAGVNEMCRSFVMQWLKENNIPVIRVPDHTHSGGFTTPIYESQNPDDPHHGSLQFGVEMLQKIIHYANGTNEDSEKEILVFK